MMLVVAAKSASCEKAAKSDVCILNLQPATALEQAREVSQTLSEEVINHVKMRNYLKTMVMLTN